MGARRAAHTCQVIDNKMYIMGGSGYASNYTRAFLSTTEVYDAKANAWRAGPDMGIPRSSHVSCLLDGRVYVAGGLGLVSALFPIRRQSFLDADTSLISISCECR
jgi:N-acetylneuraminic acid mutarotase